jgi:hypothetical protein
VGGVRVIEDTGSKKDSGAENVPGPAEHASRGVSHGNPFRGIIGFLRQHYPELERRMRQAEWDMYLAYHKDPGKGEDSDEFRKARKEWLDVVKTAFKLRAGQP